MAIYKENEVKKNRIIAIAEEMLIAARTAPKARGRDSLEMKIIDGNDLEILADKMLELGKKYDAHIFERDSKNIRECSAVVLIGSRISTLGLNEMCQLCGFENCSTKDSNPNVPCVYNVGDLNLALGSAVEIASKKHVDNRIMFTVGKAALQLNYFETSVKIAFGIPLSATSKNPFFDR